MEFPEIDNSPRAKSIRDNGRRYFQLPEALYDSFRVLIKGRRGYPRGSTLRGLQRPSELHRALNGDVLISIDSWRFEEIDENMIAPYILSGVIKEYTKSEFEALLPTSQLP